ncbi:metallophosphoesterase family protein [Candidatus Latescibacterota bacterium]
MKRRNFIQVGLTGVTGLIAYSCAAQPAVQVKKELFSFIHFSDVHIQPEKGAPEGFLMAIDKMNSLNPDFVIGGGDLIMDALEVDEERAVMEYDIYADSIKNFEMPVYNVIGNHDVFGIRVPEKVSMNHPEWGKGMFENRLGEGRTYRSFDHKGVHFLLLDSIGMEKKENDSYDYFGEIGAEQLAWVKDDLAAMAPGTPVIAVAHTPLVTAYKQLQNPARANSQGTFITDGGRLYRLISQYNFLGFLEGHMHVNELFQYKGAKIIDTASVCGSKWNGPSDGHPEGLNLIRVFEDEITNEYNTYGWDAAKYKS